MRHFFHFVFLSLCHFGLFLVFRRHGVENFIPHDGRNAERFVVVQVVVQVVMRPQAFEHFRRFETVDGVVHHGINVVSHEEPCREKRPFAPENQVKKNEENRGENQFRRKRHERALRVVGVFVVNAVQHVGQASGAFESMFGQVKKVAMQHVFEEAPRCQPDQKPSDDFAGRGRIVEFNPDPDANDSDADGRNRGFERGGFGHRLQDRILE